MTHTREFQKDVADKLTRLFINGFNETRQMQQWEELTNSFADMQVNDSLRDNYDQFRRDYDLPNEDNDPTNLLIINKLIQHEISHIPQRIGNRIRLELKNTLECMSEPFSRYYENDVRNTPLSHRTRRLIYSPRVDIGIAPSVNYRIDLRNHSIAVYPLSHGPILYEAFSRFSLVKRILEGLGNFAQQNFKDIGVEFEEGFINKRPLYLFAIEIENQSNKKHLMGDLLNSLMLAKHPVLLVPNGKLDNCLNLIQLTDKIYNLKDIPINDFLNRVRILSISQFRDVINPLLNEKGIPQLGVLELM